MTTAWDSQQARLQKRAGRVQNQLGLDDELSQIGLTTLVGSAALSLMVDRDIDLTVTVRKLSPDVHRAVVALGARLSLRADVREVVVRNDTGVWNTDPAYPDGLFLHIKCSDAEYEPWTLDIWFVDAPDRQPDLRHLRTIAPQINPETQSAILAIKRATHGRRPDGSRLPSFDIYDAVLNLGVRRPDDFDASL